MHRIRARIYDAPTRAHTRRASPAHSARTVILFLRAHSRYAIVFLLFFLIHPLLREDLAVVSVTTNFRHSPEAKTCINIVTARPLKSAGRNPVVVAVDYTFV